MTPLLENISDALNPRKKLFERVWIPEWEKIDEAAQKEDFPYSVVLDNLLVAVIGSIEVDFCGGPFSPCMKKIEGAIARQVMAVYGHYAVFWFTRTQFCSEMTEAYAHFTVEGLRQRFFRLMPEWADIDAKVDEAVRAESPPGTLFAHILSGVVWRATDKGPDNTQEWHDLPSAFERLIKEMVKTIEKDVMAHEQEEAAAQEKAAKAAADASQPPNEAQQEAIAVPQPDASEKAEAPKSETEMSGWIRTRCPMCGKKLKASREKAGKKAVCPSCKSSFAIPEHGDRRG